MDKIITKIQLIKDTSIFGNSVEGYLDIKEDFSLPINISIGDIRDVSKRKGSFSKTIVLSGNKNNNLLLNNYFDVNVKSGTFNLNKKQSCAIIQNGVVILDDLYLTLKSVRKVQNQSGLVDDYVEYDVEVRDTITDFFTDISSKMLSDINLSEFNHIYSTDNIVSSFGHTHVDGYSYTLPYISDNEYGIDELLPGVFAKKYFDKIHSDAGYSYEWSGNTGLTYQFDKLFIPYSGDKKKLLQEDKELSEVIVNNPNNQFTGYTDGAGVGFQSDIGFKHVLTPNEEKDLQGFFNPTTSIYRSNFDIYPASSLIYNVEIDYDIVYSNLETTGARLIWVPNNNIPNTAEQEEHFSLHPRLYVNNQNGTGRGWSNMAITYINPTTQAVVVNERLRLYAAGPLSSYVLPSGDTVVASGTSTNTVSATNISNGEFLKLGIRGISGMSPNTFWGKVGPSPLTKANVKARIKVKSVRVTISTNSDSGLLPGSQIFMNRMIPKNVKQTDFLKSIYQKYNLYVELDKNNPNKLIYKTRDKFYDDGVVKNWTRKLAKNREQRLDFIPDLNSKTMILSYKDDKNDFLLNAYKEETSETYGQVEVIFESENVRGVDRKEEIFSPTINLPTDFRANLPVLNADFNYNLRILVHNGVKSCDAYRIRSGINRSLNFTYPFISMFNSDINPTFDIAYAECDYYGYDIKNPTNNNLYTNFWRRTVSQINTGKLLTAYFNLDGVDIKTLRLNDKIQLDNSIWYINTIIDYDANNRSLTKVELLSAEDDLKLAPIGRVVDTTQRPWKPTVSLLPISPVRPTGPFKPIGTPLKEVEMIRSNTTSVDSKYNKAVNLGVRNQIQSNSFVIGSDKVIEDDGYYVHSTKMVNGLLEIDENVSLDGDKLTIKDIVISDGGIKLLGEYVDDEYVDDDYVESSVVSIEFTYNNDTNESTITIDADNVNINGFKHKLSVISTTASTYNVVDEEVILLVGDLQDVYLPDPVVDGVTVILKSINGASFNKCIFTGDVTKTIDGVYPYIMNINMMAIQLVSFDGDWYII